VIAVTGAAGFIGSHVMERLDALGIDAHGIDRRWGSDLLDPDAATRQALIAAEAVIHLAGCPGVRSEDADIERRRWMDNVVATERVLDLVPERTPLVVASSSSVYGPGFGRASVETDPLRPLGGYARSKVAMERRCAGRRRLCITRPFSVIGPRQREDMALARWSRAIAAGDALVVYGSTTRTRDFTDVRVVARALVDLATGGHHGVVNIGSGRPTPLSTLIEALTSHTGLAPRLDIRPASGEEPTDTWASTAALRRFVGWTPTIDLATTVADAVAAHPQEAMS
jgi:nucleoside-diphosphate-sugar epimerase